MSTTLATEANDKQRAARGMLGRCTECGKEVSNKARSCPHCGAPVKRRRRPLLWSLVATALIIFVTFLAAIFGADENAPTRKAGTTQSEEASKTVSSSKVELPAATTEKIAEHSVPAVAGLNVARSRIQSTFSQTPFSCSFEDTPDVGSQPRVMGETADGLAIIELIGPASNLTTVSCVVGLPNDSPETLVQNTLVLLQLLKESLPNWNDSAGWLPIGLEQAVASGESQTTIHGAEVKIQYLESIGMMTLTIEAL